MDDPRWLRLITIGLVLAALAVGYFLLTGRFTSNSEKAQVDRVASTPAPSQIPAETFAPSPTVLGQNTQTTSAPNVTSSAKGGAQTLPRTGFPLILAGTLSASAIVVGWGLRRFPH